MTISVVLVTMLPISWLVALLLAAHPSADSSSRAITKKAPTKAAFTADFILLQKSAHRLTLFHNGQIVRTYLVALGDPVGDKVQRGDNRTPEGLFMIDARVPNSQYHLALHISYPDARHRAQAAALGVDPGGDVMIHGLPNGQGFVGAAHREDDWTKGCIAVTDEEIEEIYRAVPVGTQIEIRP